MKVQVVRAWPGRHEAVVLDMPAGSTVADAIGRSGLDAPDLVACAVFGVRAEADTVLVDGDRVELLRALVADPKESRRRRAQAQRPAR